MTGEQKEETLDFSSFHRAFFLVLWRGPTCVFCTGPSKLMGLALAGAQIPAFQSSLPEDSKAQPEVEPGISFPGFPGLYSCQLAPALPKHCPSTFASQSPEHKVKVLCAPVLSVAQLLWRDSSVLKALHPNFQDSTFLLPEVIRFFPTWFPNTPLTSHSV